MKSVRIYAEYVKKTDCYCFVSSRLIVFNFISLNDDAHLKFLS